jgi:hypothetical protein
MKGEFMQNNYYQNRNGKIHSEKSREGYLSELKEVEHELTNSKTFIKKIMNENFEYYNTEREGDLYNVRFKKSGENKYKKLEILYGENYKEIVKMFN